MIQKICLSSIVCLTFLTLCESSQAQMFFESDWLYYGRNDGDGSNVVSGPESIGLGDDGYGATAGYRLTIGGSIADFDVDASFMQLDTWNGSSQGEFNNLISFDADGPGGSNMLAPFTTLNQAASSFSMSADETTENEQIRAYLDPVTMVDTPLTYAAFNKSNLRQFEINFGTRRESNWWRAAVGYRHVNFDERSGLTLNGVFDAPDIDPAMPDDPNDGLSSGALTGAGLTGAGSFMAIDQTMMVPVDILTYQILGAANNEMDGAQLTGAVRVFDGRWITIEGIGKVGIYRNRVSGAISETIVGSGNSNAVYQRVLRDDDTAAAFAGNIGVRGTVSLTDYINFIVGYDVLFLGGVALSGEQTDGLSQDIFGDTNYSVQNDGTLVAHGANLGLELLW